MARKAFCEEGRRLSDHVTLGVLTMVVPVSLVDTVLRETGRARWGGGQLAPRLMVYYVMALALYARLSYGAVLRELVEGLRWLRWAAQPVRLATKSAITQARVRLGVAPMRALFAQVARPIAEPQTRGAWYRQRRLVSFDGTTIDVPDWPDLERSFGRPAASRGVSGFPQIRLLTLVETGTRAIFAASLGAFATSEVTLARQILPRLTPGMLCLADRGFIGYALWRDATATGTDLLWRVRATEVLPCLKRLADGSYISRLYPSSACRRRDCDGLEVRVIEYSLPGVPDSEPIYRLITTLLEPAAAPAAELAALYHERWENEITLSEIKVALPDRPLILRSRCPELIVQEVYGFLLTHFAIRSVIHQASCQADCDPDTLSFVNAVRVIRRNLPFYVAFPPGAASAHAARPP